MDNRFELYLGLSLASAALAGAAIIETGTATAVAAATLTFASMGLYAKAEEAANQTGKTGSVKLGTDITPFITEILLIGAAASTSMVPKAVGIATISTVAMLEVAKLAVVADMRKVLTPTISRNWRLIIIGVTFLLSAQNTLYLFYGIAAVAAVAAYNLLDLVYRALYT